MSKRDALVLLAPNAPLTKVAYLEATMAVKEVIHFPFLAQLSSRPLFPGLPSPEPVSESPP
jgi:hypothetical protein